MGVGHPGVVVVSVVAVQVVVKGRGAVFAVAAAAGRRGKATARAQRT